MSGEAIKQLIERWTNDEAFRNEVRKDPEAAVRATGLELTEEEWAGVRAVDWSLSDEELQARVNKTVDPGCLSTTP